MNIAKLISPITLHAQNLKQKKQTLDNYNTQQIHTPISIPNELPHHQRIYFKQSQFQKNNTECDSENTQSQRIKYKKIDNSLNQIDKLKNKFAKRLKTQTFSQQKFLNKSNQRHLLKPSPAPKIGIATSEFTVACFANERNNVKEQTFSFQVQAISPKEAKFSEDSQNNRPVISYNQNSSAKHQNICNCQKEFVSFIESMRVKMQNMAQKVKAIQQKKLIFKSKNKKNSKNKSQNDQNSIKTKYKTQNNQQKLQHSEKYSDKSNHISHKQDNPIKINKAKMQTLLQRLQLRIEKQ